LYGCDLHGEELDKRQKIKISGLLNTCKRKFSRPIQRFKNRLNFFVKIKPAYSLTKFSLIGHHLIGWGKKIEQFGAGEILLTPISNDGTKAGFSIDLTTEGSTAVNIPVIASGGAGSKRHFKEVFEMTKATGGLAASIFYDGEIPIPAVKNYLKEQKIAIR